MACNAVYDRLYDFGLSRNIQFLFLDGIQDIFSSYYRQLVFTSQNRSSDANSSCMI